MGLMMNNGQIEYRGPTFVASVDDPVITEEDIRIAFEECAAAYRAPEPVYVSVPDYLMSTDGSALNPIITARSNPDAFINVMYDLCYDGTDSGVGSLRIDGDGRVYIKRADGKWYETYSVERADIGPVVEYDCDLYRVVDEYTGDHVVTRRCEMKNGEPELLPSEELEEFLDEFKVVGAA